MQLKTELQMTAAEVQALIHRGFEARDHSFVSVEEVAPGLARVRLLYKNWMLRPGKVLSGPALFTAADMAMYALVLSHTGPQLMAVTANLNIHFLAKAEPGDILAEARLLKLGRRLAVMDVTLASAAAPQSRVAHVTGSYALLNEQSGRAGPV